MTTTAPIHAVRMHHTGGPEVLRWEPIDLPPPGAGEVRVRHKAIGLNFIDTYHRTGLYPLPLPSGLGSGRRGSSRRSARTSLASRRAIASPTRPGRSARTPRRATSPRRTS